MYDLMSGIITDPEVQNKSSDEQYKEFLETKFNSQLDIDVIMSVQNKSLSYYELIEVADLVVNNGSHFGPSGYWIFCNRLMSENKNPIGQLDSIKGIYEDAVIQIGYH